MHHNANIYTQKKKQMHIHITVLAFRFLDLRMSDQLTETTGVPEDASFRSSPPIHVPSHGTKQQVVI